MHQERLISPDSSPSKVPVHDDFSLSRRIFAVVGILLAVLLLIANVFRVFESRESLHWLSWCGLLGGIIAADFLSGLIHWSADTWGSEDMPIIGRRLLHPFRVHHVNPADFLRRRFIDTNGDVAWLVVPMLVATCFLPLQSTLQLSICFFMISFCGVGLITNQVHQWAHMRNPPWIVKALQACGVILTHEAHAQHHHPPYVDNYCIATGWCNRPLTAIDFFRRLERAVTLLTGWQPRTDDTAFQADVQKQREPTEATGLLAEVNQPHA